VGRGGRKIRTLNDGLLRHPVFADRTAPRRTWRWKDQTASVRAGFFDDPARRAAPQVRDALLRAMREVAEEITRRA